MIYRSMTMIYISNRSILLFIFTGLTIWISGAVLVPSIINVSASDRLFIKGVYNIVCHQLPDRSFHFDSHPFFLCVRCTAFYLFGALLTLIYILKKTIKMFPLLSYVLFILPAFFDFLFEKIGIYHDIISLRFFTGALLGLAFFHLLIVSAGKREDELNTNQGDNLWITKA
jgi:uncharacterized membrane protein